MIVHVIIQLIVLYSSPCWDKVTDKSNLGTQLRVQSLMVGKARGRCMMSYCICCQEAERKARTQLTASCSVQGPSLWIAAHPQGSLPVPGNLSVNTFTRKLHPKCQCFIHVRVHKLTVHLCLRFSPVLVRAITISSISKAPEIIGFIWLTDSVHLVLLICSVSWQEWETGKDQGPSTFFCSFCSVLHYSGAEGRL